jgi:adhesin transport system membrane fusion protein
MTGSVAHSTSPFPNLRDIAWISGQGHLAQSIKLEEQPPRRLVTASIAVLVLAVVGFVTWAALTHIGEVASASGEVTPVGTVRRVQHLEGGIVAAFHVHEGDHVTAGQPLVELEPGMTQPELAQFRARLAALDLQRAQLLAFQNGEIAEPLMLRGSFSRLATAESDLLKRKRAAVKAQEALLLEQVEQRRAELQSLRLQSEKIQEQLALVGEQVATRAGLVEKRLSPRMGLLDLQRDQARVRAQLAEVDGQAIRAERAIAEAEARIPELLARTDKDVAEGLTKNEAEAVEVRESIRRSEDRVTRLTVRSPVEGVVKGLQTETVGGVIQPGSTILEVIPNDVPLVVEARVQTKDVGFVHAGDPADVKVSAYDYTRFGHVHGVVETISATTFQDEKGMPFYRARIRLDADHVGTDRRNRIVAGMTVLADIRVGEKTVLAYLLKPIVRAANESLRER